jgi:hypothetical protein
MTRPATSAIRLTFVHKAGKIQLQSRSGVDAIIPTSSPSGNHGFWAELRDRGDKPLFKQLIHNPLSEDREVFSPDAARSIARAAGARAEDVFSILVPNLPEADSLTLVSSEHEGVGNLATKTALLADVPIRRLGPQEPRIARTIARFHLDD